MEEGISEKAEVAVVDLTRTRAHELIKLQQQNTESVGMRFINLFKRKAVDTDAHLLSYGQLLLFYIILEVPVTQLFWHIKVSRSSGGMNAFVSQIIITLLVHFPLFMLYTTMAYYSEKGYIKFWECIPIFKGLSYTTVVITLVMEVNNISEAGITVLYIFKTFYGIPWKDCNFAGADDSCIPQHPKFDVATNNCEFASNEYNKYNMRNIFPETTPSSWYNVGSIKADWAITIWICCFVVCISSTIGLKKYSSFLFKLIMVALFGFAVPVQLVSVLYYLINEKKSYSLFKGYKHFLKPKLWIEGIILNMPSNSPGVLIYLSSVSPDKMKYPVTTAFRVFLGKILFLTLFMTWYSRCANQTLHLYKMHASCLDKTDMLQFTVFADALTQLPFSFVWLNMHYIVLLIVHLSTTTITITATVNSIFQGVPSLNKYRFRICALVCCIIACFTMITTTEGANAYSRTIKRKFAVVFLVINVIALCGIVFIYGAKTVKHDILFIYKSSLTSIFWCAVTLLPIMLMLLIVRMIGFAFTVEGFYSNIIPFLLDGIVCLPLLLVPIYQLIKNAVGKQPQSLFTPGKGWGVERKLRKARQNFNPDKQVEYNAARLKCDHYCLVGSTRYKREIFTQTMLYQSLLTQIAENNEQRRTTNDNT